MRNFIPASITSKVALAGLKLSKHSPHILFGAGIVGVAASGVLAARATLKLEFVLDEHEEMAEKVNNAFWITDNDYGVKERRHDLALLYTRTTVNITKLYGPALIVGGLAVAALTGSHHILTKRNAALTAAYAVLDKGFKEYRGRVVEDQGVEKDNEYYKGIKKETVTETSEDGKSVKIVENVTRGASPYGVLFNAGNPNWNERPELNYLFIRGVQNYMNDLFKAQGYLFLSDVYDALGFQQTKASRVVGWHKKSKDGDNYVDFGVFENAADLRVWEYLTSRESELYLDFNVDGIVHDLL